MRAEGRDVGRWREGGVAGRTGGRERRGGEGETSDGGEVESAPRDDNGDGDREVRRPNQAGRDCPAR